jgi:hypothetical protein
LKCVCFTPLISITLSPGLMLDFFDGTATTYDDGDDNGGDDKDFK